MIAVDLLLKDIFINIFFVKLKRTEATVADYVGGDTASFRPLKLDEEEIDEDVFEEQQDSNN